MSPHGGVEPTDPTRGSSHPGGFWTRVNISEAVTDVMTPLCWSFWSTAGEPGVRAGYHDLGIVPRREIRSPATPEESVSACFYGRIALNVELLRRTVGAIPGASADDFERDMLGAVRPDAPPVPTSLRRLPAIAVKSPIAQFALARRARRLHADQLAWWQANVLGDAPGVPPDLLEQAFDRFRRAVRVHMAARTLVTSLQAQVIALARRAGLPDLFLPLFSGLGGVTESALAEQLWALSRGHGDIGSVISRYGFHGSNEGNLDGRSWREDPAALQAHITALRNMPDTGNPARGAHEAAAQRKAAFAELLARLPRRRRPGARLVHRLAAQHVRSLQLSKESFLIAIDGGRAAARAQGARLAAQGAVTDPDDLFYLSVDESRTAADAGVQELIDFRRRRREEYRGLEIPVTFTGMPTPRRPDDRGSGSAGITGIPASPGTAEGPVRVISDPADSGLSAGEIIVCRVTDPSWTPLFMRAKAAVIDIGSTGSHGAIIARELSIPCVIGTSDASTRLYTGQRVHVDGYSGEIRVMSMPDARKVSSANRTSDA
ncbi:PEP-utilizing enzyme [Actinomadura rubrisoli]|uniref:Peptidase n=1 Tax=Actinomadura rubrisoli TaxID=2530368 RepID=A0A4R5BGQ8_9ACTN|nr:PEP-utilizing enzyme [Actinomadura rubrisoli]TDD84483.1 peptidase [Actinomadura rubrisoli]